MVNLCSDNISGALPAVLDALAEAGRGPAMPYGNDPWTKRLESLVAEVFEHEVVVMPVATGTAANALSLSLITPPWGKVFCHEEAHALVDECGAPELFTGGARLTWLEGENGKLDPATLAEAIHIGRNDIHQMQPAAASLTNVTEIGTVYTPDEVGDIARVCRDHGLKLHMDGARLSNAVAALGCTPAEATWKAGVDVLSLGGTKGGCLAGEAVVLFDTALAADAGYRRKRVGHLFSKMRMVSAQMCAWLEDGRWLEAAAHANGLARTLGAGLVGLPGVHVLHPVVANMVFATMPPAVRDGLLEAGHAFYPWEPEGPEAVRLVTSFETTTAEVDAFLADARTLAEKAEA